jgi:hypothetical protein
MTSLFDFLTSGNGNGLLGDLQMPRQQPDLPDQRGVGFTNGIGNFLSNNPLTLMALGGGIAQGGIGRGLQTAVPAAQAEQKQRKEEQMQGVTYNALRTAGVPHGQALAGALNPEILKTIARAHFEPRPSLDEAAEILDRQRAGSQISSINSIIGRLQTLVEAPSRLDALSSAADKQSAPLSASGPMPKASPAAFESIRDAFANEVTNLLRSGGMSHAELGAWRDRLLAAKSPAELRSAIGEGADLIDTHATSLKQKYEKAVGHRTPEWLTPKSRTVLESLRQWAKQTSSPDER